MVGIGGFKYQPVPAAAAVPQGQLSAADRASGVLKDYVAHLTDKNTGKVKPGVLYLRNNADGTQELRRDRAYHLSGRGRDAVKNAGTEVKSLFQKAYQDRMDPRQYAALERSLDTYLTARAGQMGTKSLVRFQAAFERAANRHEQLTAHARALPATVTAGLAAKANVNALDRLDVFRAGQSVLPSSVSMDQEALSDEELAAQRQQRNAQALMQAYGEGSSQAHLLGEGGYSNAFLVKGEPVGLSAVVTVPVAMQEPLTVASLGTGELAAATARAPMPHVAKPTSFLLRVAVDMNEQLSHRGNDKAVGVEGTQHETYEVPATHLRAFLETAQAQGSEVTLSGVKMPAGPATHLGQACAGKALDSGSFLNLASGMYQGLQEIASAGLVHHDIKPQNVAFDASSGQVMLVDTGATVQLDRNTGQTTQLPQRTEMFTSPQLEANLGLGPASTQTMAHGAEADRYAFALTLMCALSPSLMKSTRVPDQAFMNLYAFHQAGGSTGALDAFMKGLGAPAGGSSEKALSEAVEGELKQAFDRDPVARSVIAKALDAGMTQGSDSDTAWNAMADLLRAQGLDLPAAPGSVNVAMPVPGVAASDTSASVGPMSMLPAGDPKREARFVLPTRTEVEADPFDNFEMSRRTSFYENKA